MKTFLAKKAIVTLKHAVVTGKHAGKAWQMGRIGAVDGCEGEKDVFCIPDRPEVW